MKTKAIIYFLLAVAFLFSNCKPEELARVTKLQTVAITDYTATAATASAKFIDLSDYVTDFGHCWGTSKNPTISNSKNVVSGTAQKGDYTSYLTNLTGNTIYYVRAYAQDGDEVVYGNEIDFQTPPPKTISIISPATSEIWGIGLLDTIIWNDNIDESVKIELYKGGSKQPDITTSTESDGIYVWTPQNLSNGNDYSIKIISLNDPNVFGTSGNFTIAVAPSININQPESGISWIKGTTHEITWTDNLSENLKIELFKGGTYSRDIDLNTAKELSFTWIIPRDLVTGSDYSIKISSVNNSSIFYTSGLFTITETKATVITAAISDIKTTSATSGGNITDDGGASVTGRGVCYNTTATPTILNTVTVNSTGVGTFTSTITGLTPATTYYLRAYAINAAGTAYGEEKEFTTNSETQTPPTAAIAAATEIKNTTATLNGATNANGNSTTVTFEYGLTNLYGSEINATPGNLTGTTTTNVSAALTGLTPGAHYHFSVKAVSVGGTVYSGDQTFSTTQFPVATTLVASDIETTAAKLNATINATGLPTTVTFDYGQDITYGLTANFTANPVMGSSETNINVAISGLTPGKIYHYRVKAVSTGGTTIGDDQTFTTLCTKPLATTSAATNITNSTATLNGTANANNFSTTVSFEYGENDTYGNTIDATQSTINGIMNTAVSVGITGLSPNKLYHYRVRTVNCGGPINGNDQTFTTLCTAPTISTISATNLGSTKVTLNTIVNANDFSTTVTFEYGTTISYGNSAIAAPNPVTGSSNTNVSAEITGLLPGTLYHFRAKVVNCRGTVYSNDFTLTTYYITITSPLSSDHWVGGETHSITWNDNITENVRISLYKNGVVNQTIVSSTPSNGIYNWLLPNYIAYASDYSIHISSVDNSSIVGNSQLFKVSEISGLQSTMSDIESNTYATIKIGTQWWMKENLKTTKYKNNTNIPMVTDAAAWSLLTTPGYCWYNNDAVTYKATYGALYNWYTVNTENLCPADWHVPSDAEWTTLIVYLGESFAGGKLRETGTTHWLSPNSGATNESGFTALPGGYRHNSVGNFDAMGMSCNLWSSTANSLGTGAYSRTLSYGYNYVSRGSSYKSLGIAVRCIKD